MGATRSLQVHFIVADDGEQCSALCYEFTTAGSGPDEDSALHDAIVATVEYLQYMLDTGRWDEAPRPAPPELVMEYLDLPVVDGATVPELKEALHRAIVAAGVMERKLVVEYDLAHHKLSCTLPPPTLPSLRGPARNFPTELVLANA